MKGYARITLKSAISSVQQKNRDIISNDLMKSNTVYINKSIDIGGIDIVYIRKCKRHRKKANR